MHSDGGPSPQLRGQGVPQHLGLGVVAGRAERLAEPRVVFVVAVPAAIPHTVRAAGTLPVGVTRQYEAPLRLPGVDPTEAGGGEGHKQPRMGGHRLGHSFATAQPSRQEVEAVGLVGR